MTHNDIYTKFMIEYDKANITSSYPSLTKYEVATLLNKAYLAVISQKITGQNTRKAAFEADVKSMSDIQPLEFTTEINQSENPISQIASNEIIYDLPKEIAPFLYYVQSYLTDGDNLYSVMLLNHQLADKFRCTENNTPWMQHNVAYLESNQIHVLANPYKHSEGFDDLSLQLTYIRKPKLFESSFAETDKFELSDAVAEEVISLAIVFATETTESSRLSTKVQTLPLES